MPTDSPRERREHDRKAPSAPRPGLLFIVSRDALDYYEHLRRAFAGNHKVAVILDRRSAERRGTPRHRKAEPRSADRRPPPPLHDPLRREGGAILPLRLIQFVCRSEHPTG